MDRESRETGLARLLAKDEIRELAHRYALAVDSRDFEGFARLFTDRAEMVMVLNGRVSTPEGIARTVSDQFHKFGPTIHYVCNQVVDLVDEDHATGVVYTRAEHEIDGEWVVQAMNYWDRYERTGRGWLFARRELKVWYALDILTRPQGEDTFRWPGIPVGKRTLPDSWDTYRAHVGG